MFMQCLNYEVKTRVRTTCLIKESKCDDRRLWVALLLLGRWVAGLLCEKISEILKKAEISPQSDALLAHMVHARRTSSVFNNMQKQRNLHPLNVTVVYNALRLQIGGK